MSAPPSLIADEGAAVPEVPLNRTDDLIRKASATTREFARVFKLLEGDPGNADLNAQIARLRTELSHVQHELREKDRKGTDFLKSEFGVDDAWLREFVREEIPVFGDDYMAADIQRVPSTFQLEDAVAYGYGRLMSLVDQDWLRAQAAFRYRQSYDRSNTSDCRLHIVGRQRLLPIGAPPRPQRFAQMLLACDDFLKGRSDIDLFDGPLLVSEAASLGASLDEIRRLGTEAERKLKSLPTENERDVASTVYELLVGAACVRAGRDAEMLPAMPKSKSPDFRIHDRTVPLVVECKRRLGLNEYAEKEARNVERLYAPASKLFDRHHPLVEVEFTQEVSTIADQALADALAPLCGSSDDDVEQTTDWGIIRRRRLPIRMRCATARVFSPVFLSEVFGWNHVGSEWDGMICQIDPIVGAVISQASAPRCLKWRCDTDTSRLKKARGVTSLWGDAVQQIPTGEVGCVYIAYTEGMRPEHADARTQNLLDSVRNRDLYHRNSVMVPLTMINRLYPQALGNGGLEMIESVIPITMEGHEFMLADFPTRVFHMRGA